MSFHFCEARRKAHDKEQTRLADDAYYEAAEDLRKAGPGAVPCPEHGAESDACPGNPHEATIGQRLRLAGEIIDEGRADRWLGLVMAKSAIVDAERAAAKKDGTTLDQLSDRDLLDAGMWALHDAPAALLAVMRLVIVGDGDMRAQDDETTLSGAVLACAKNAVIGRDARAHILAAFEHLGVARRDILKAAAEIAEAS